MSSFASDQSYNTKTIVSFNTQALKNSEAIQALQHSPSNALNINAAMFVVEQMVAGKHIAEQFSLHSPIPKTGIEISAHIKYNFNAFKNNMDDCLELQTQALYYLIKQFEKDGYTGIQAADFDLNQIKIGKYWKSAIKNMLVQTPPKTRDAIAALKSQVVDAQRTDAMAAIHITQNVLGF